jgi:hypothetical protein
MKNILIYMILLPIFSFAQVGIGTSSPAASAQLEVNSTNKGFLLPRISLTGTSSADPVISPVTGLLIYNTATISDVNPGFYYWSGSAWIRLIGPNDVSSGFLDLSSDQTAAGSKSFTGNVRVGTSSATSSAVFEIVSTTQGFLPPKMTKAQRDAIASPAVGLIVFCTNCGLTGQLQIKSNTGWTNMIGGTPAG